MLAVGRENSQTARMEEKGTRFQIQMTGKLPESHSTPLGICRASDNAPGDDVDVYKGYSCLQTGCLIKLCVHFQESWEVWQWCTVLEWKHTWHLPTQAGRLAMRLTRGQGLNMISCRLYLGTRRVTLKWLVKYSLSRHKKLYSLQY